MLKNAFLILVGLMVAIGVGAGTVSYALNARSGVGAVNISGWTAFPDMGTPEADPYSKARVAREGVLTLGRAEGLAFTAQRDSNGDGLRVECSYVVEGTIPPARFWTLYPSRPGDAPIQPRNIRPVALHSYEVLRLPDNSVSISVGPKPTPGNWLALHGSGPMTLNLTLYDTPIASSTGLTGVELPQILKVGCDAG